MSRVSLFGMLVVLAIACKSSDKAGNEATPGSAAVAGAGKVLEASGQVTIGGKPATVGLVVAADDVVQTGEDGRVVIELTHNLAHWQLGPNKQQKVSDSIAWKLPRDEGNAKIVIQDMTSAGRPAERSAADSDKSAPPPAAESAPGGGAAPAPAAAPAPPPRAPARAAAAPPPPPAAEPAPAAAAEAAGERDDKKEESAPRTTRGAVAKGAPPLPPDSITGSDADRAAIALLGSHTRALQACVTDISQVSIDVTIAADGTTKTKVTGTTDAKVRACIEKIVHAIKFAHAKAIAHVDL